MKMPDRKAKKIIGIVAITVVLALVGAAAAAVVSDVYRNEKEKEEAERQQLLQYEKMREELRAEKDALESNVEILDQRYSAYIEELASLGDEYFYLVKRFEEQNKRYRFYAGMTAVSGAGIEISLDDGNPVSGRLDSLMVVHDTTLLGLVDSLRAAGAQAISINGERIIAMTDIECVGTGVKVNGRKLFAPFTIKAIGNPNALHSAFLNSDAYRNISVSALKMDLRMSDNITIPKYSGTYYLNKDWFN